MGQTLASTLLHFSNNMPFTQIGSDGGYLKAPASLTVLTISPGERVDLLVDFSNVSAWRKNYSSKIWIQQRIMKSRLLGQIMQFTVTDNKGVSPQTLPSESKSNTYR